MCPHTAVGRLALNAYNDELGDDFIKVTVATAHPAKFSDNVNRIIGEDSPMPTALADIMTRSPHVHLMKPSLDELADYIDATQ